MQIQYQRTGGIAFFPGLSQPVTFDTAEMPPGQARELETLLQSARFFEQPLSAPQPAAAIADAFHYTLTVQDGSRCHTLELSDPLTDPDLRALVRYLQSRANEKRRQQNGG